MNFDYTYIDLFGFRLFEPMVAVTNGLLCIISLFVFKHLQRFKHPYPNYMSTFMVIMGVSSVIGAVAHGIHHQFGVFIFDVVAYISNALNLVCVYFCFMGSYVFQMRGKSSPKASVRYAVIVWIVLMLIITLLWNNFVIIKIHAGLVLIYSLIVHLISYTKYKERGSGIVSLGIFISFFSILVHSLHLSLHEYFNHKDIAHVIMIISLVTIYKGIKWNSEQMLIAQPNRG